MDEIVTNIIRKIPITFSRVLISEFKQCRQWKSYVTFTLIFFFIMAEIYQKCRFG